MARPVEVRESNYFFALPRYQDWLERCLAVGGIEVVPQSRRNEVISFVRQGLTEFSISRASSRTRGWGIAVPGDEGQSVYVWVDALINYLSALGYGSGNDWREWWNQDVEKIHVIGKNVWKFHAVYWPALLRSAGLPLPDKVVVHGFVTVDGQKIGKSLGNVVDPFAIVEKYGVDAVRYYLLRAIPAFGDGDFGISRFDELYRVALADGIGNLVSRLASLCEKAGYVSVAPAERPAAPEGFEQALESFEFDKALEVLWRIVTSVNRQIEKERPWKLVDDAERLHTLLVYWLEEIWRLVTWLEPLLPTTSRSIAERLFCGPVHKAAPLFPRS